MVVRGVIAEHQRFGSINKEVYMDNWHLHYCLMEATNKVRLHDYKLERFYELKYIFCEIPLEIDMHR